MERVQLVVQPRDQVGSREARRLRRSGLIPAVIYGSGKPAVAVAVDPHSLREALHGGTHAVLDVVVEGHKKPHVAIVKELELDKVKHNVTHVDFQEIKLTEAIETNVAVEFEGTPVGVKMNGGMLDVVNRELAVSALPTEIPERLVFDVEALDIGDVAHVSDLQVPEGLTVLTDLDEVLCSVLAPRVAEVAVEGEEGEEAPAAEAEPEVVGERETESEE